MRVRPFTDPAEFRTRVRPFLDAAEAERTILIGIIDRFVHDPAGAAALGWGEPLLVCVEDDERVILVGMRTAERNMVLSSGPPVAIAMLADHFARHRTAIPGVIAPAATASNF